SARRPTGSAGRWRSIRIWRVFGRLRSGLRRRWKASQSDRPPRFSRRYAAFAVTYSAARATALLSVALVLNQIGLMAFPAVLPTLMAEWRRSEGEAGWSGGIYFAGYAAAVPLLSGLTDRIDGRRIYAVAALIGAAASFAFALVAEGFWTALIARL